MYQSAGIKGIKLGAAAFKRDTFLDTHTLAHSHTYKKTIYAYDKIKCHKNVAVGKYFTQLLARTQAKETKIKWRR